MSLQDTSTNWHRQVPPQYSSSLNSSVTTSTTSSSSAHNLDSPTLISPTISSVPKPITFPTNNTSIKYKSKRHFSSAYFKQRYQKLVNDWVTDWWCIELISWIISASSLLAIFGLLESHRGRPLPEWPLSITVNSLVSIFATIGQMAMMQPVVECISQLKWLWFIRRSRRLTDLQDFDDASRGPTGSLVLLSKLRGMHLVSLGAAITVVSIAFGPMSQQVVTYPLRLHAVANASAQQADFLNVPAGINIYDISPALAASISVGLNGKTQSLSSVIPSCNTGNCTWDTYSSLGICTSTIDMSSALINNTCNGTAFDEKFDAIATFKNPGYPCFNYSLPVQALVPVLFDDGTTQLVTENATLTALHNSTYVDYVDISSLAMSTGIYSDYSIMDINFLYQPGINTSLTSTLAPPITLRSSLQLCIQTYNTTVFDSKTTTELISSSPLNSTLIKESAGFTESLVNGSTFNVSANALIILSSYLQGGLSGYCTFLAGPPNLPANETVIGDTTCSGQAATAFLQDLEGTIDSVSAVSIIMENIAISMTNTFRSGAGGDFAVNEFQGTAYLPISYVETNYIWLTLPISLVLLTLIFLLATITKSQRVGAKNWKSSNFAILQGLHANIHNNLGGLESSSVMEEKIAEMVVRLDANPDAKRKKDGWRLVQTG